MMRSFGPYQLLAPLAKGGSSELFLARHTGMGGVERLVVIKQLIPDLAADPEYVTMFLDEARLGAKLIHPNVVYTLDMGNEGGRAFIALEYLEGFTVGQLALRARQRVPGGAGLPLELVVAILRDAARGLHAAHEARLPDGTELRIVHRDVSPQNVIVTYGGDVKIVDFGVAHAAVRATKTQAGVVKGKDAYMAPEQIMSKPVDRRTDVFALGVLLWELGTGERLFKRRSHMETMHAVLRGVSQAPSQRNPRIDATLDAIILRALSAEPGRRQPTAAALADELERWLAARGVGATAPHVAAFYAQWFAPELEAHRRRMLELRAGRADPGRPLASETWDGEGEDEAAGAPQGRAGPEERTVVGAGLTRPRPKKKNRELKALLILGAVLVFAVAVALLTRLLR